MEKEWKGMIKLIGKVQVHHHLPILAPSLPPPSPCSFSPTPSPSLPPLPLPFLPFPLSPSLTSPSLPFLLISVPRVPPSKQLGFPLCLVLLPSTQAQTTHFSYLLLVRRHRSIYGHNKTFPIYGHNKAFHMTQSCKLQHT